MMQYKLVQLIDGDYIVTTGPISDVIPAIEIRGFKHDGYNFSKHCNRELQGKPKFKGLAGPMDGSDGFIRYETWEVNERLST